MREPAVPPSQCLQGPILILNPDPPRTKPPLPVADGIMPWCQNGASGAQFHTYRQQCHRVHLPNACSQELGRTLSQKLYQEKEWLLVELMHVEHAGRTTKTCQAMSRAPKQWSKNRADYTANRVAPRVVSTHQGARTRPAGHWHGKYHSSVCNPPPTACAVLAKHPDRQEACASKGYSQLMHELGVSGQHGGCHQEALACSLCWRHTAAQVQGQVQIVTDCCAVLMWRDLQKEGRGWHENKAVSNTQAQGADTCGGAPRPPVPSSSQHVCPCRSFNVCPLNRGFPRSRDSGSAVGHPRPPARREPPCVTPGSLAGMCVQWDGCASLPSWLSAQSKQQAPQPRC